MNRTVEGLVVQVIGPDERDHYALGERVHDGLEFDEDLIVIQRDPHPERVRKWLSVPFLGEFLELVLWPLSLVPALSGVLDVQPVHAAVELATVEQGDWVEVEIAEAVVDETRSRGQVEQREVHLHEVVDVERIA